MHGGEEIYLSRETVGLRELTTCEQSWNALSIEGVLHSSSARERTPYPGYWQDAHGSLAGILQGPGAPQAEGADVFQGTKQLVIKSPCSSFNGPSSHLYPLLTINALSSPLPLGPSLEPWASAGYLSASQFQHTHGFCLPTSLPLESWVLSSLCVLLFFFPLWLPTAINDFLPTYPVEILTKVNLISLGHMTNTCC